MIGARHALKRGADERRDRALQATRLRVLRLQASLVVRQPEEGLRLVAQPLVT
jgi:very-short-patch-repair endonuclease